MSGLTLIIAIFITFGCSQYPRNEPKKSDTTKPAVKISKTITEPNNNKASEIVSIESLDILIPIEIIGSKNKEGYIKYQMEFNGNCYDCDLAHLSITEKSIMLTNVCDKNSNQAYEVIKVTKFEKGIEIKTKQNVFVFNVIDKSPIYELKTVGNKIENETLRLSKYYISKKTMNKFIMKGVCGGFDG